MNQPTEEQLAMMADAQARIDEGHEQPGDKQLADQYEAYLQAAQLDHDDAQRRVESQSRILDYALDLIIDSAQSAVDDDIDEDGVLAGDAEHRAACDLAQAILNGLRTQPGDLIRYAKVHPDTDLTFPHGEMWEEDAAFAGGPDPDFADVVLYQDTAGDLRLLLQLTPALGLARRTHWAGPWRIVEEPGARQHAAAAAEPIPAAADAGRVPG